MTTIIDIINIKAELVLGLLTQSEDSEKQAENYRQQSGIYGLDGWTNEEIEAAYEAAMADSDVIHTIASELYDSIPRSLWWAFRPDVIEAIA